MLYHGICATCEREYDERGNVIKISYYGIDGKPRISIPDGFAGVEQTYDEHGRMLSKRFLGTDGKPMLGKDGSAVVRYEYDDRGLTSASYYGLNDEPVNTARGYTRVVYEYREGDATTWPRYFDLNGKRLEG